MNEVDKVAAPAMPEQLPPHEELLQAIISLSYLVNRVRDFNARLIGDDYQDYIPDAEALNGAPFREVLTRSPQYLRNLYSELESSIDALRETLYNE